MPPLHLQLVSLVLLTVAVVPPFAQAVQVVAPDRENVPRGQSVQTPVALRGEAELGGVSHKVQRGRVGCELR